MQEIWARIEEWYRRNAPNLLSELQPGASEEEIAFAELRMGVRFPKDLRESYQIHNGSWGFRMFPKGSLMGLEGIVYEWNVWKGLLEEGALEIGGANPEGPIKPVHWNVMWIPLTDIGCGNHFCADLDPTPGGSVGQIIYFHHEEGPVRVVSRGFAGLTHLNG